MQEMGVNWAAIGQVMALAFIFGLFYAGLVRWMAVQDIEGLTAFIVAFGVLVTVLLTVFVVGWYPALVMLATFAASGAPMIVEYVMRVHAENKARREAITRDAEAAQRVAKELLG
jgi:hypothetical protein